jgi:adenylate kinase family enzyme
MSEIRGIDDKMKLYVTGSVASGKSTLAKKISKQTGVPCYSLDEIVYKKDDSQPMGNRKRTPEERDSLFAEILVQPSYIIEDTGRLCFEEGMRQADNIILIDNPLRIRKFRIIRRYIRQKLGIEKCAYRPNIVMAKYMFRWAKDFDSGKDGVRSRIMQYKDKVIILKSNLDIEIYLKKFLNSEKYNIAGHPM